MINILSCSKDEIQERLKKVDSLLVVVNDNIKASTAFLTELSKKFVDDNSFENLYVDWMNVKWALVFFCDSVLEAMSLLNSFSGGRDYLDLYYDYPIQKKLLKIFKKYSYENNMELILRIFMQINNISSFDELRTELRNSISEKASKIKVENFVKFLMISDMLNLSFKNFLNRILKDVSYIKKETIPLATELKKALELKNFDDPDEIGRDYYDNLKQIEEFIKTNCGVDIDTEGYIVKDLYEDEEEVVYLDNIEGYNPY